MLLDPSQLHLMLFVLGEKSKDPEGLHGFDRLLGPPPPARDAYIHQHLHRSSCWVYPGRGDSFAISFIRPLHLWRPVETGLPSCWISLGTALKTVEFWQGLIPSGPCVCKNCTGSCYGLAPCIENYLKLLPFR